ncbi:MAG: hypothetical protein GY803_10105 [Chloroflexi bacterium]|nr:hypothetical protein [Chloroflexota bacterium]
MLLLLDALQAEPLTESQQVLATELQDGLAALVESLNGYPKWIDQVVNEQAADSQKPMPLL